MNQWPAILNIVGLIADMVGVIGLFFTTAKGLSKIKRPRSFQSHAYAASRLGGDALTRAFDALAANVNAAIDRAVDENKAVQRRANRWLIPIVLGFMLQLIAAYWQFCLTKNV